MIDAVRHAHRVLHMEFDEALRMASLYPARAIGRDRRLGPDAAIEGVWIRGERVT